MNICKFQDIENACLYQVWRFGVARCTRVTNDNCKMLKEKEKKAKVN